MTNNIEIQQKENVIAGIVGALLFALAGGVLWFVLYQVNFIAGISGIVAVVCAIKGYSLFAKKESLKGVIISVIAAILIIVVAWYMCLSVDVYKAHQQWYAEGQIDYTISFAEAVRGAYLFLSDGEIMFSYLFDLGIGFALCCVGAYRSIANAVIRVKQEKEQSTEV